MTAALEGSEWSAARSGGTLPTGKPWYPFYRRLSVPQGRSGRAENLDPTGIRSRNFQPVAQSLYRLSYSVHIYIYTHTESQARRWTAVSSRDRWQSVSVCTRLTAVGNSRADEIDLVTQTNEAVSACAVFHASDHLLLSLMAGEHKTTRLKYGTPTPSQLYHEYFCGISRFIDDRTKTM